MSRKTRKLMWSVPLMAVLAVAGALAMFAAQMPGTALAHDPPGVVTNLTGEADGQNQIDLSWDAPAMGGTPTGYRIDRSEDGNTWMTHVMDHAMTKYSDTGLKPNMTYYYRVFAVNSAGTGPVSQDYQVQTDMATAPGGIIGLSATPMGHHQINLMWTPPAKTGGQPITKYSIHFASGEGELLAAGTAETAATVDPGVIEVDAMDGTSYMHKGLIAETRYRYVVYAHNVTDNATITSNVVAATTADLAKPGAPTGVTAVQSGARDFNLYWYAPTNTGGQSITGYKIEVSYNGRAFIDLTGAEHSTTALTATTSVDHSHTAVPDNVPEVTPDTPITTVQYRVYATSGNAADEVESRMTSASYGQSPRMTIITVDATRTAKIPAAPDFSNAVTTDLDADRDPKGNVNLKWTAPASGGDDEPPSIGGYRIDVSDDGMVWRNLVNHSRKTDAEYQYIDAEMKNRHYRIFAWHAQYLGPAQENVVVSTLTTDEVVAPGHVRSFTATAMGSAQIDLSWMEPASDGNAPIVRYQIAGVRDGSGTDGIGFADFPTTAPDPADPDDLLFDTSKTTGYMHKDLDAGETWKYQVLAVTDDGTDSGNIRTSAAGSAETRMATTPQAALPEAPEGLTAEDAKDSSKTGTENRGVLLQWNAPNPPDGAEINGYRIQRKKGDAAWETIVMDTNSIHTDDTDPSEPAAGEMRMYRVAALNGSKVGAYSDPVYYPAMMHNHPPGMPMDLRATPGTAAGTIDLMWTAGDNVTGHYVTGIPKADLDAGNYDNVIASVMASAANSHMLTGLQSGVEYYVVIIAVSGSGESMEHSGRWLPFPSVQAR